MPIPEKRGDRSKKKIVQDKLLGLIKGADLQPGDKLPSERELAQNLCVSRNILREAMNSLSFLGLIEIRERQGAFVGKPEKESMESVKDLQILPADFIPMQMEVRLIISVPAARLAALRRTREDLRKLWACYENFSNCPYETPEEQAQNGKWEALLHHLVTEAAHNALLSRLNEGINALVERNNALVHPYTLLEAGWFDHIRDQHYRIIKAIEEKRHEDAGRVLEEHLLDSVQVIKEKHPDLIANLPTPYWDL